MTILDAPTGTTAASRMRPAHVWLLVAAAFVLVALRYLWSEGGPATILFASSATLTVASVIAMLTRRLLIAMVLTVALVAMISIAAAVKLRFMNMVLHAYDLVFYLTSPATMGFLWQDYRHLVLAVVAAFACTAALAILAWRLDPVRIDRSSSARSALVFAALAAICVHLAGERRHSQFEYEGQYVSSFILSWSETIETLWRGTLIESAAASVGAPFRLQQPCVPAERPPHVILIHHESIVPPSLFPSLGYDKRLDPFFLSDDGSLKQLRVETYGGASTLTEFSILTGLSTYAFGGMRQFVQSMMAGKIRETLPQALAQCGYRTVVYYPMLKSFVSAEKFFNGIGLREIVDARDQKARLHNERDGFYYGNALDGIARHLERSQAPLFSFIETMATHWPYDTPYMPEVDVSGGAPGTHPELNEYLRRLAMAQIDYEHLRAELARRFPAERFLIVRYGDHHPMATRMLLGFGERTEAEDVVMDRDSLAFITFYAVNGVNFDVTKAGLPSLLDVPWLGVVLQQAAGLPLSDAWRERQRLMGDCGGRYAGCVKSDQILAFHRRLIDSGLMVAR